MMGADRRAGRIDAPAGVQIRQACATDYEGLRDFLAGLSLRTRYLRFFAGVVPVTPAMLRRLIGGAVPGQYVDVLVAIEGGVIIGHGMSSDDAAPSGERVTEMGVVVADARQNRGVGTALMRALAARAPGRGATAVIMDVLAENQQMLSMIEKQFPAAPQDRSGPYVTVRAGLPQSQEEPPREPLSRTAEPQRGDQPQRPCQAGQPGPVGKRDVTGRAAAGLPLG
jgi:GNAT superfamily N-acetyltransferase